MPEMRRVLSSHVMAIGYDPDTRQLHVRYAPTVKDPRGPLGSYLDVDPELAEIVMTSPSIGSAISALLKKGGFDWQPAE